MQRTYQELYPEQRLAHLAYTVEQHLSANASLWWVEPIPAPQLPIACLWLGRAIDQVTGNRHTYVFLLYVNPEHRKRGVGSALMHHAEAWAKQQGDRQIGLQVFHHNQPALNLYNRLGYEVQSLTLVKPLQPD